MCMYGLRCFYSWQDFDCNTVAIELYQTLSVVFLPEKKENNKICKSQVHVALWWLLYKYLFVTLAWSLSSLFTRTLHSHCPLSGTSRVLVDTTGLTVSRTEIENTLWYFDLIILHKSVNICFVYLFFFISLFMRYLFNINFFVFFCFFVVVFFIYF